MENNNMSSVNTGNKKGSGALVGSIIVVILLIIGGIYMYNRPHETQMMNEEMNVSEMPNESGSQLNINSTTTIDQSSQSNSDDLDSIDKDLNETDLNSLEE